MFKYENKMIIKTFAHEMKLLSTNTTYGIQSRHFVNSE